MTGECGENRQVVTGEMACSGEGEGFCGQVRGAQDQIQDVCISGLWRYVGGFVCVDDCQVCVIQDILECCTILIYCFILEVCTFGIEVAHNEGVTEIGGGFEQRL